MRTSLTVVGVVAGLALATGCESPIPLPLPPRPPVVAGAGADEGTLAVNLEPTDGVFIEGFDVTLRYYDVGGVEVESVEWHETVPPNANAEQWYRHVHRQEVPAGAVTLKSWMRISPGGPIPPPSGPGCTTPVLVGADDQVRVTLLFTNDPQSGDCAALTSATREADDLLAMPRGLPAPGFVGLTQGQAQAAAAVRGWTTRVVARDGEAFFVTEDYIVQRVNLVMEQGIVVAAARG
jgi:hypothetical protein